MLSAIIDVHVVGDNTALYTAGGALLGVVVGAGGSWLQQRSKIGADEAQLEKRLTAEKDRLEQQLQDDRDSKEMDSVRNVLDEALIALEEHSHTMLNLIKARRRSEPDQATVDRLQAQQRAAVKLVRGAGARIALWFDRDDPVVTTFEAATATMAELLGHMRKGEIEEAAELNDKLDDQTEGFQDAARARMAAKGAR